MNNQQNTVLVKFSNGAFVNPQQISSAAVTEMGQVRMHLVTGQMITFQYDTPAAREALELLDSMSDEAGDPS